MQMLRPAFAIQDMGDMCNYLGITLMKQPDGAHLESQSLRELMKEAKEMSPPIKLTISVGRYNQGCCRFMQFLPISKLLIF
jgi:hypothetical protein